MEQHSIGEACDVVQVKYEDSDMPEDCYKYCAPDPDTSDRSVNVLGPQSPTIKVDEPDVKEEPCDGNVEYADVIHCADEFEIKSEEIDLGCDYFDHSLDLSLHSDIKCEDLREFECARPERAVDAIMTVETEDNTVDSFVDVIEEQFVSDAEHTDVSSGEHSHYDNSPRDVKPFQCKDCEKTFYYKSTLKKHALTHSRESPHKCKVCEKTFTLVSNLNDHMLTHTHKKRKYSKMKDEHTDDELTCNSCDKLFIEKRFLTSHMERCEKRRTCNICYKLFATSRYLKLHVLMHTGQPQKCNICKKKFALPHNLQKHMLSHMGGTKYVCHVCGKEYLCETSFKSHVLKHNCIICEKPFTRSSQLNEEMLPQENSQICEACEINFAQEYELNHHLLQHTGDKPYTCNVCNKKFMQTHDLVVHMLTHELYKCNVCNMPFNQKETLEQHMLVHKKRFNCKVCKQNFAHKCSLKYHMCITKQKRKG